MDLDPSVQKIINAAKRYAIAADAQVLGFDEILVALASLHEDKDVAEAVAKALGTKVKWPTELLRKAELASSVDDQHVQASQFTLEPRFKDVFNALRVGSSQIRLEAFLAAVLLSPEARECPAIAQFLDAKRKKRGGKLGKLDETDKWRARIENYLRTKVIGQDQAIRALAESYNQELRDPRRGGLQGIFTFMGPPGVGKTLLAEEFASALNTCRSQHAPKYATALYSLENQTVDQLFGTPPQFRDSDLGLITKAIKENANRVLIFDEVEKASGTLIQSFLTLLNKGGYIDQHDKTWVDASKCFVVFTTNLGQESFSSMSGSGRKRGGRLSSEQLFDILASAKRRELANIDEAAAVLSPEFVDRLRQGKAILFNQLAIADYKQLMRISLGTQVDDGSLLPQFRVSEEAAALLILSLLPDLSARRLVSESRQLKHRWAEIVRTADLPSLEQQAPEHFTISVDVGLDEKSKETLVDLHASRGLKMLVVDNDERMTKFIDRLGDLRLRVEKTDDPASALEDIAKKSPDLVLLDWDLNKDLESSGGVLALQKQIREAVPSVPLWIFSESSVAEPDDLLDLVAQGGARGYFAFQQDAQEVKILKDDQQKRFEDLVQEAVYHRIMGDLTRSRSKLTLGYNIVDCQTAEGEPTVKLEIARLTKEQHVSMVSRARRVVPAEIPDVEWEDVFGLERAIERLKDAVELFNHPERLAAFGIAAPSGYLLAGPSGTGKTHLARAVARAAGRQFYPVSCGELVDKYVGESEKHIRDLFHDARQYGGVIFIDEIDSIAIRRSDSGNDSHSVKLLNQLLTCMDGFAEAKGQVLVLAATNRREALDPAITRPGRFDETIPIELPNADARKEMLERLLSKMPCEDDVMGSIPLLVPRTSGSSPAEIDRIIREAVYMAVKEERNKLSVKDLEIATNFVIYGADKRDVEPKEDGPRRRAWEDDRRRTAWHEAGHAVASRALFPENELDLLTIKPNEDGSLGFAAYANDETRTNWSADDFRKRIIKCLAGREAERLCDGAGSDAVNTGISSDYTQATRLAWDFVARYGFDEKFGIFSVSGVPDQIQNALAGTIHARVNDLLSACLEDCRRLMEANRECLRKLADELLDKKFIYGNQVRDIVDQHLKPVATS